MNAARDRSTASIHSLTLRVLCFAGVVLAAEPEASASGAPMDV